MTLARVRRGWGERVGRLACKRAQGATGAIYGLWLTAEGDHLHSLPTRVTDVTDVGWAAVLGWQGVLSPWERADRGNACGFRDILRILSVGRTGTVCGMGHRGAVSAAYAGWRRAALLARRCADGRLRSCGDGLQPASHGGAECTGIQAYILIIPQLSIFVKASHFYFQFYPEKLPISSQYRHKTRQKGSGRRPDEGHGAKRGAWCRTLFWEKGLHFWQMYGIIQAY